MEAIRTQLIEWYRTNQRSLPWRQTRDPYRIWLSEVILQQTRVAQGLDYYLRFINRYPNVGALAAASEDEVLKLWQGLGYYSRARALHAAAHEIVTRFGSIFPRQYEAVHSLPGVGDYTAAAICSFAYDTPIATVDGNVYRVLSRLFDLSAPIDNRAGQRLYMQWANELLDTQHPALHNQAIMEFGALQCTPQTPHCTECPLEDRCLALSHSTIAERPVTRHHTEPRARYFHYLDIRCNGYLLLHKRSSRDIWRNLYEFPMIESSRPLDFNDLCQDSMWHTLLDTAPHVRLVTTTTLAPHKLSHQTIHARFFELTADRLPTLDDCFEIAQTDWERYAVSRLMERYMEQDHPSNNAAQQF